MTSYAYFNGKFGKREEITIPLSDRSIFFGDAIYDAMIGCYDRIMWEEEHIDRLLGNAKRLGIKHGFDKQYLSSLLREIAVKSMIESYFLYVQLSRDLPLRRHSAIGCGANLLVTVEPLKLEPNSKPLKLLTVADKRYGFCDIKTVNLLPAVLSATEAEGDGYDEAIFVKNGIVTECTKSNISIIKQGRIITHPNSSNILPGITRAHLLDACRLLGVGYEEAEFTKDDLYTADEILVTSTTKLCKTADKIDGIAVGGKDGKTAQLLSNFLYSEYEKICIK